MMSCIGAARKIFKVQRASVNSSVVKSHVKNSDHGTKEIFYRQCLQYRNPYANFSG